jgi:hypothetical protein
LIKATLARRHETKEHTRNLKRMEAEKEAAIAKSMEYQEQQLAFRAQLLNRIYLEESNNPLTCCYDCGSTVSKRAMSCPKCGAPITARRDLALQLISESRNMPVVANRPHAKKRRRNLLPVWLAIAGGCAFVFVAMQYRLPANSTSPASSPSGTNQNRSVPASQKRDSKANNESPKRVVVNRETLREAAATEYNARSLRIEKIFELSEPSELNIALRRQAYTRMIADVAKEFGMSEVELESAWRRYGKSQQR